MQDGIINVFKPRDWTSHDIVAVIKKIAGKKVGHTGTLDPLAQGVLPILIGKGTGIQKYLNNYDKIYQVELQLGKKTTTLDEEGEVLQECQVPENILSKQNIENVLQEFVGKITQTPPIYSAIKVKGKKLYEYARKGQEVQIPKREITIYKIKLNKIDNVKKTIEFEVKCSKGTYIRTLCEDIATELGTIGYMKNLIRIQVGDFNIKDSVSIEEIKVDNNILAKKIISIEEIFKDKEQIDLGKLELQHFLNGVKIHKQLQDDVYRVYCENQFIGLGLIQNKSLKRDIIL